MPNGLLLIIQTPERWMNQAHQATFDESLSFLLLPWRESRPLLCEIFSTQIRTSNSALPSYCVLDEARLKAP